MKLFFSSKEVENEEEKGSVAGTENDSTDAMSSLVTMTTIASALDETDA